MTLSEYMHLKRPALEQFIHTYLQKKEAEVIDKSLDLKSIQKIANTITQGKLLRGILILFAYESRTNKISPDILRLAAAMELFHTGLLIHDDIMDNDHLRRGKPTVIAQAITEGTKLKADNPVEYGQALAICIGDLTFFMGHEIISSLHDISHLSQIWKLVAREMQRVGYAQIADVHFALKSQEPTEEEIISVYTCKTARYSFSLPLMIGGLFGGYEERIVEKLGVFGEALGIVYQIKDDELDIFGNEKIIGKPLGSDIRENKKTLLRRMLLVRADEKIKKKLMSIYESKAPVKSDIEFIKKYMEEYEVIKHIQKVRENYSQQAERILKNIQMSEKYKHILQDLIVFTSTRNK